jgi:gliding motility-associated-like protein
MALRLSGEDASQPLTYRIPLGDQVVIPRSYEVSYLTQVWNERLTAYESVLQLDTLRGSPLHESLTPPLTDTEVEVAGDLFARHFGVEQVFRIDSYTASALDVRTDTTIVSRSTSNIDVESELLAPCEVRFTAYANTPVASLFIWQIVRSESPDVALVRFTEPEISYMFDRVGEYDITLEVSDRLGLCVNTDHSYHISVTETQVLIPNAFSPGVSIGVNDIFKIAYRSVVRFQGQIFNRWGAELYRWSDPAGGWDGKYRGRYVPAGTYFYIIEYTGTDGRFHRRSGDVTVIRSTKTSTKVEQ